MKTFMPVRALTRAVGVAALLAMTAAGLSACGDSSSSVTSNGATNITLTSQPNETGFAQWLADKLGYFKENGLTVDIKYASSGPAALAAGASGDWQAGWTGGPPSITGFDKFGLISVGPQLWEEKNLILFMRADALKGSSPAEVLSGSQVATVPNSTSTQVLFACAKKLGVDPKRIKVVPLDPPAALQALKSGRVPASTGFSSMDYPYVSSDKYVQVCDGAKAGIAILDPYIVTPKFYKKSPAAAAAFIDAVYRANEYINANPDKSLNYLLEYDKSIGVEATKASAKYALSVRHWLTMDDAVTSMKSGGSAQQALQGVADFFVETGVYTSPPDIEKQVSAGLPVLEAAAKYRKDHGR